MASYDDRTCERCGATVSRFKITSFRNRDYCPRCLQIAQNELDEEIQNTRRCSRRSADGAKPDLVSSLARLAAERRTLTREFQVPTITFILGLPGSGKSVILGEARARGVLCLDDYNANAKHNSSRFEHSLHFDRVVAALNSGIDCFVSDIDLNGVSHVIKRRSTGDGLSSSTAA